MNKDKGTGVAVSVELGSSGVEAFIALTAAIRAFPATQRLRSAGWIVSAGGGLSNRR